MYRALGAVFLGMYVKNLYRQSKLWFVIVTLFAAGQLFINYKNGVEFSPFYHYSMFSLPFHFTSEYKVTEVMVNGQLLKPENFTPNGWDNIVIPVVQYQNQQRWNSMLYSETIKRFVPVKDSSLYVNRVSQAAFDAWYQKRVLHLADIKDSNAQVQYRIATYHSHNDSLLPE